MTESQSQPQPEPQLSPQSQHEPQPQPETQAQPQSQPGPQPHPQPRPAFAAFVDTIAALRAPDGCPWDREQTHGSIASNMLEEAYEAVDAIEAGSVAHLREELGDVLLQVVLQSQIAADAGEFTIDDVCRDINAKMVRRHPHVFGDASATDANEVLDLWDQVKLQEKPTDAEATGLLDGVPRSFPALMQAQKLSRKAAAAGFEWEGVDDVWDKVAEEVDELKAAYAAAPKSPNGKVSKEGEGAAVRAVELEFGGWRRKIWCLRPAPYTVLNFGPGLHTAGGE